MKWQYIVDVISINEYHEIAHKFAGKTVKKEEVEKLLFASRPDVKEWLGDYYNFFVIQLTDRIKEEPYAGEENACLFDNEEEVD